MQRRHDLRAAVLLAAAVALTACGSTSRHTYAAAHGSEPEIQAPRVAKAPARQRSRGVATIASLQPIPIDPSILEIQPDSASTEATTHPTWAAYTHEHRFDCVGPRDQLAAPAELTLDHGAATLHGWHLAWRPPAGASPDLVTVGVLGATKDAFEDTLANLDHFLAVFDGAGVDVIVLAGDIGYTPEDIAVVVERVAASGRLVLALAGNAEPVPGFHRAIGQVAVRRPNLIDGNLVRLVELGPASLVTLPGYYDPRFIASEDGCHYGPDDVEALAPIFEQAAARPVLVSHGPPRSQGPGALDVAYDAGNVGDPRLAALMRRHGVRLGLFSHILESGGRATDPITHTRVAPGTWSTSMWLNAGAATSLPQDLHGGRTIHGMAAIVELGPAGARYRIDQVP